MKYRLRYFFLLSLLLFAVGASTALLMAPDSAPAEKSDQAILASIGEGPEPNHLLFNNLVVSVYTLVFPLSALVLFRNGFSLALHFVEFLRKGASLELALSLTVPHSVFELSAFFAIGSVSFQLAYEFTRYLRGHRSEVLTRGELRSATKVLGIAVLFIVVAAVIEAYLTIAVAKAVV